MCIGDVGNSMPAYTMSSQKTTELQNSFLSLCQLSYFINKVRKFCFRETFNMTGIVC
jgi:hypothetical protein